jgi:hypothetical protein
LRRRARCTLTAISGTRRGYRVKKGTLFQRLFSAKSAPTASRAGLVANMTITRASRLLSVLLSRRAQRRSRGVGQAAFSFNRRVIKRAYYREKKRRQERQAKLPAAFARNDKHRSQSALRRKGWAFQLIRVRQKGVLPA